MYLIITKWGVNIEVCFAFFNTPVWYSISIAWPHWENVRGAISGEGGGWGIGPFLPIHQSVTVSINFLCHAQMTDMMVDVFHNFFIFWVCMSPFVLISKIHIVACLKEKLIFRLLFDRIYFINRVPVTHRRNANNTFDNYWVHRTNLINMSHQLRLYIFL